MGRDISAKRPPLLAEALQLNIGALSSLIWGALEQLGTWRLLCPHTSATNIRSSDVNVSFSNWLLRRRRAHKRRRELEKERKKKLICKL